MEDGNPINAIGKIFGMNTSKRGNNTTRNRCTVRVLPIEEAYRKIKSGSICLIDVRTEMEYKTIRVKGSMNIPLDRLQNEIGIKVPSRSTEMIIYCATGSRVRRALQILWGLGYTNLCIWDGAGINTFAFQDLMVYNNENRAKGEENNGPNK